MQIRLPLALLIIFNLLSIGCSSRFFNNPFDPEAESGFFKIMKVVPVDTQILDLTFSTDALWIVNENGSIIALNYFDGSPQKRLDFALPARGVAYDGENLWVSVQNSYRIFCLNPLNGALITSFDAPRSQPLVLAYDFPYLYAFDGESNSVFQFNPQEGRIIATFKFRHLKISGIYVEANTIFILDQTEAKIFHYTMSGSLLKSFLTPAIVPSGLTRQNEFFWSADKDQKLYQYKLL